MKKAKVLVAMSGGVDSSVAAKILLDQGYDVTGATMQIWQDEITENGCDRGCCSLSAVEDARLVAATLGIPYYVLNFKENFKEQVIAPFVNSYWQGETPNPCILCNRHVKFEQFLQKALSMGFDYIATGHYGRVIYNEQTKRYSLALSVTAAKDQTYALYTLTQDQLAHLLLPIGDLNKDQVRQLAAQTGLDVANKRDSQEICFVHDNNYAKFVEEFSQKKSRPGNFVLTDGTILGKHRGLIHYTIGQRKGLGIAYKHPLFVKALNIKDNEVILTDDSDLYQSALIADDAIWSSWSILEEVKNVTAKVRYRASAAPAKLYPLPKQRIGIIFTDPQRAITPGQAVVCYQDNIVVGGATIESATSPEKILEEYQNLRNV